MAESAAQWATQQIKMAAIHNSLSCQKGKCGKGSNT